MLRVVSKAVDILLKIFEYICLFLLIGMVLIAIYGFIARYVINRPAQWGEPLASMCFVWMALLSSALAIAKRSHIRIELLDLVIPSALSKILDVFAFIGIGVFAAFMIKSGIAGVQLTSRNIMPSLGIKTSWLYASIPVAGVLSYFSLIKIALDFLLHKKEGNHE